MTLRSLPTRIAAARVLSRRWAEAETAADVAGLTADWLTGSSPYNPAYGGVGHPDVETTGTPALLRACIALCGAGVITLSSQPGGEGTDADGTGWRSRAYLYALADQVAVHVIRQALAGLPGVHVHAVPLRRRGDAYDAAPRTVATLTTRGDMSYCGDWHPTPAGVARYYGGLLSTAARRDITRHCAHLVTVWADDYGDAGNAMWGALAEAAADYRRTRMHGQ